MARIMPGPRTPSANLRVARVLPSLRDFLYRFPIFYSVLVLTVMETKPPGSRGFGGKPCVSKGLRLIRMKLVEAPGRGCHDLAVEHVTGFNGQQA